MDCKNNSHFHFNAFKEQQVSGFYMYDVNAFFEKYPQFSHPHALNFYAVYYIQSGEATILTNDKTYTLNSESIILISPCQEYQLKLENVVGKVIMFCLDFYIEEYTMSRIVKIFQSSLLLKYTKKELFLEVGSASKEVRSVVDLLFDEYVEKREQSSTELLRAYLNILLIKINNILNEKTSKELGVDDTLLIQLTELIEDNFKKNHAAGFYSEQLKVSENHLNKVVQQQLGLSVKSLINKRLMIEARKLLMSSDLSVSEIAFQLHYSDNSYFNKVFLKHHSITPGYFREVHKKHHRKP